MSKGIKEMTDQELQAAADAGEITVSALVVEQDRRHSLAHPEPVVEGWTLDRVMLRPGTALEELLYYRRRVQELLEAANRYLERARAAEAFIAEKSVGAVAHIHKHGLKMLADGLRADVYPTTVKHEHMRPLFTAAPSKALPPFQDRVRPWMLECFGAEIAGDKLERGDRLLEEVFELLQSGGYPRQRIRVLESYVYARPAGEPRQEVGGAMVTLAAYCLAHGLDMHDAGETELARVWTNVEAIRAKQAAKPTGSAIPIAVPPHREGEDSVEVERRFSLEWIAGARPPVHPSPMRGRQSFRSIDEAIAFMSRLAADAQFVSLTEYEEREFDRSEEARVALAATRSASANDPSKKDSDHV